MGEEGEGEEAEDAMEDSDEEEEDDTAERMDACGEAPETPPTGYKYAPCPPLETEEQHCSSGRSAAARFWRRTSSTTPSAGTWA